MYRRRSGFTLIEILVVITIIGSLIALAVPMLLSAQEEGRVTDCKNNVRNMSQMLKLWTDTRNKGRWPKESGIRFVLVLARDNMVEEKDMKVFLCQGTQDINTTPDDPKPGSAYKDWDDLDPNTISYAGRDQKNFPINTNKAGSEVIVADDNDREGGNHQFQTVFGYADGSVGTFDKDVNARERDLAFAKEEAVVVGEASQVEELKKLQID